MKLKLKKNFGAIWRENEIIIFTVETVTIKVMAKAYHFYFK